jgi:hypothetical protein
MPWIVHPNNQVDGYADLINAGWESAYAYGDRTSAEIHSDFTSPFAEPAVLTVNSSGDVMLAPLSEIGGGCLYLFLSGQCPAGPGRGSSCS